jgi:hypothetical protein
LVVIVNQKNFHRDALYRDVYRAAPDGRDHL